MDSGVIGSPYCAAAIFSGQPPLGYSAWIQLSRSSRLTVASPHPVRIQICGTLAIERDGQRLDARLPGRQGRLLFTYQLGVSPSPATRQLYQRLLAAT